MRRLTAAALAFSVIGTSVSPTLASPVPAKPDLERVYPGESYTQYLRYYGGGPYYHRRHYYRGGGGNAVAAGVV